MILETLSPPAPADDPTYRIAEAAAANSLPLDLQEAEEALHDLEEALKWTATEEAKHPRWPANTPAGLGGEFMPSLMRIGQRFNFDGKEWEIAHVLDGKVVAHEASGKVATAQTREFDPTKTPGPKYELTGATRPKARKVKGGRQNSDVTVVDPYVDFDSHDPSIPLPANSKMSAEDWGKFGRLEQLHYQDLQARYGAFNASGASNLIKAAYADFEHEIQSLVSSSYSDQYVGSSGFSLSITRIFQHLTGNTKALEDARQQREKAKDLQGRIRDAYAWDLYNRTKSPDVTMVHKDKYNNPTSWWKSKFIDGNEPIFSGLSMSHYFRSSFWSLGGQTGVLLPMSIRHVVMATWISGPMKGAVAHHKSEKEFAVPYQLKVDERAMSFNNSEIQASYRTWLEGQTEDPAGGDTFRQFKEAVEAGGYLPVPPPKPDLQMHGQGWLPPPQEAADAMAENAANLPGGGAGNWTGTAADLKAFDLPWENLDEQGNPEAKIASESGYVVGDFLMGMKGTLYWLGPDPADTSGLGLRIHKMVPDGAGGMKFGNENYTFKDGMPNYKLKGNVAPPTLEEETFDPEAWVYSATGKKKIAAMDVGDKFKVEGITYEKTSVSSATSTPIRDLTSGLPGVINSDYSTVPLVVKEGYSTSTALQPQKGMSLAYDGKKHVVTAVKKDGTVSIRPTGGKVVSLAPDDPALEGLFDHGAWKQTTELGEIGDLQIGDYFQGGRGDVLRPQRIDTMDDSWVYWTNLDTGADGKSLRKKKARALVAKGGTAEAAEKVPTEPTATVKPPENTFNQDDPVESEFVAAHATVIASPVDLATGHAKPEPEVGAHHGYTVGQIVEMQKASGKTWKATVTGSGTSSYGEPVLHVEASAKGGMKTYTVKTAKVITTTNNPAPVLDAATPHDKALDSLPDISAAFDAYKSSHGPGGAYKYDRLRDLSAGTVFRDKKGKLWKIQVAGTTPMITDGNENFIIDGALRGRMMVDETLDGPPPPAGPGDPLFTWDELDPVPPYDEGGYGTAGPENEPPAQTVSGLPLGTKFVASDGSEVVGITLKADGDYVIGKADVDYDSPDQTQFDMWFVPPDTPLDSPDLNPPAKPYSDLVTASEDAAEVLELNINDDFEGAGGHPFQVIAKLDLGKIIVQDKQSHNIGHIDGTTPQSEVRAIDPVPAAAQPAPGTEAIEDDSAPAEVAALLKTYAMFAKPYAGTPTIVLDGYKSTWGSGAKYKHDLLADLQPGDRFRDKSGNAFVYLRAESGGMILIYQPEHTTPGGSAAGTFGRVTATTRVRKL